MSEVKLSTYGVVVGPTPPTSMTFTFGNDPAVTLHADGRVEIHGGRTANEAAHAFWVAVHELNPAEDTIASLRQEVEELREALDGMWKYANIAGPVEGVVYACGPHQELISRVSGMLWKASEARALLPKDKP